MTLLLFLAGIAAIALGFYRIWCCADAQPGLFTIGAVGLVGGALLGILRDWLERWRRRGLSQRRQRPREP
jgi:hypothetical protein